MSIRLSEGWQPGQPIGYIRDEIPEFEVPAYVGERHVRLVPDTLDLQERSRLAVNALTRATDPLADHEMYFNAFFDRNPPMMQHNWADMCQSKFMESLPLMRLASGSELNAHVDECWMETALHQLGTDGLAYLPARGRPWAVAGARSSATTDVLPDQHIIPAYCGRLLSAMMLYHRRDGGPVWKDAAERLVDGLVDLAVDRGRYAYYAPSSHWAEKGCTVDQGRRATMIGAHVAFVALGLVHVYRETGYGPAIRLAGKLVRYTVEELHYFGPDGSFTPGRAAPRVGWTHFHMHTYALLAMLEYARVTDDATLLELAQRGFLYGRDAGEPLMGFFPWNLSSPEHEITELCGVADMIALALKLTEAGAGDYWDDVDRWVRNVFAEGQLTPSRAERMERYASDLPLSLVDPACETTDRVGERNVGAFAGTRPNDWCVVNRPVVEHCCTSNATRALYFVWEHMLTHEETQRTTGSLGKVWVNLLLNRSSPWADVDSYLPYVGQVDITVRKPVELTLRISEWVSPSQSRIQVNGSDRRVDWLGRYAVVADLVPGDVVRMTFPISERTDTVWIEKRTYTLVRKGNDVVAIDPPGRHCPLYQREHYRQNTTSWREAERFVSDEHVHW